MPLVSVLAESALRALLIAGTIGAIVKATRIESAAVRHGVWTGVLVLMLASPILSILGLKVSLPVVPAFASETVSSTVARVARPTSLFVGVQPSVVSADPTVAEPTSADWVSYATTIYFVGLVVFLIRLALGTLQVRKLVRTAAFDAGRLTHALCATPVTVGWLRPVVILPNDWSTYGQEQLDAILIHETEHVRRRDPFIQWLALLNRAVFWFHPLAWWLERQLSALAEQACDAAVIAGGCDPVQYSRHLLDLARATARARGRVAAIGMTMPGARLPERIHLILNPPNATRVPAMRAALTAVLCGVTGAMLTAGRLTSAASPAGLSVDWRTRVSQSVVAPGTSRGFAIYANRRLRAHGAISDQDRIDAAKHARGTDHAWLLDSGGLYVITEPQTVRQAFALYEWADSCSVRAADVPLPRHARHRPDECQVSEAEMDAARVAPDLVPDATVETKARIARVLTLLASAARNGQAVRIR
jgi:beta-lactamase regulating signal transducer with metallopeptidase domain